MTRLAMKWISNNKQQIFENDKKKAEEQIKQKKQNKYWRTRNKIVDNRNIKCEKIEWKGGRDCEANVTTTNRKITETKKKGKIRNNYIEDGGYSGQV